MKKILLYWYGGCDIDLVHVPDFVADNLYKYQRRFDKWLSNRNNNHGYWIKDSEGDWGIML
jgi:hypothetical protein